MTASHHTPGPWHSEPEQASEGRNLAVCAPSNGWIVATIAPEDGRPLDAIDHANARLIAAAPVLLSLLKDAHPHVADDALRGRIGRAIMAAAEGG